MAGLLTEAQSLDKIAKGISPSNTDEPTLQLNVYSTSSLESYDGYKSIAISSPGGTSYLVNDVEIPGDITFQVGTEAGLIGMTNVDPNGGTLLIVVLRPV